LTSIASLQNAAIDVDYHPETLSSKAHWVYEPDKSIAYHRLLLRSNFVPGALGHWTEANAARSLPADNVRFHNEFAYPINTLDKPEAVQKILAWARNEGVVGLGRWGLWEHLNSDVAVAEALQMASELCPERFE
jgi:hypothetical protein